jgi:hypothetical protein
MEVWGQVTLVGDMVNVTRALSGGSLCGLADALHAFPGLAQAPAPAPPPPRPAARSVVGRMLVEGRCVLAVARAAAVPICSLSWGKFAGSYGQRWLRALRPLGCLEASQAASQVR